MKDGAGDLDFGADDSDKEDETETEPAPESLDADQQDTSETSYTAQTTQSEPSTSSSSDSPSLDQDTPESGTTAVQSTPSSSSQTEYPYFVRRSNVGDERDNRLECHVRDSVLSDEAQYLDQLAAYLGEDSISKTDAREYAFKYAFQNPEEVAEMMVSDGFEALK